MDMNKTYYSKKEAHTPNWRVFDANNKVLGRLATEIADAIRGKDKPEFTPHSDAGDYVVVINAEKIKLTGDKWDGKIYDRYTGYMGGYKTRTAREQREKDPTHIIHHAVKGMLPKNKLSNQQIKKLKVYAGSKHPHAAQIK